MRAVLQRVVNASVAVDGNSVAAIGAGLLVLLGVATGDGETDVDYIARKIAELRIFADDGGRFNRSVVEAGGSALVVSQFTLLAETHHGRRPGFTHAALPEDAEPLVLRLVDLLRQRGISTQTGRFGAQMHVSLLNDGPVTIILDSKQRRARA